MIRVAANFPSVADNGTDPARFMGPWWDAHTFVGDRFILRPPRSPDAEGFVASIDDVVRSWQGWPADGPWSIKAARRMFARSDNRGLSLNRAACPSALLVCTPANDGILGWYTFFVDRKRGITTLGWHLGPRGRGHGLATPTLMVVLAYGHSHLGISQITMETNEKNERARRQIEGAGASEIGLCYPTLLDGSTPTGVSYGHDPSHAKAPSVWSPPCPTMATVPEQPRRFWQRKG